MATDLNEFLDSAKPQGFTPKPHYSPEGDSLTFYFDDTECYEKRIDNFLTLFVSEDDDELVGCQIKGVRRHLEKLGKFGVRIQHKELQVSVFLYLLGFLASEPRLRRRYIDLAQAAKNISATLDDELVPA